MNMMSIARHQLADTIDAAARAAGAIPPVWPLATSVAVNPFLGQSDETLAETAARLARVGGIPVTMPRDWYRTRFEGGELTPQDIDDALSASGLDLPTEEVVAALARPSAPLTPLPTLAHLGRKVSDIDWPDFVLDRIGHWAAGYFDEGQALWQAPRKYGIWASWRRYARHDLTPEIMGLDGFARLADEASDDSAEVVQLAVQELQLSPGSLETYFHALLISMGGWAHVARHREWTADLAGEPDDSLRDLLAIRLLWEVAMWRQYAEDIETEWRQTASAHAVPLKPTEDMMIDAVLQEATERAGQRAIAARLAHGADSSAPARRPALQAVFCIDVRSEVYRRALESVSPEVETLGFAGFFGLGLEHHDFASDIAERRLPVLLNPSITTQAGGAEDQSADRSMRYRHRAVRAWGRFKVAAVSSFAFVEAAGPFYLGKLVREGLCLPAKSGTPVAPQTKETLAIEAKADAAHSILSAMALTGNFGRLVVLAGHGATVVNNPHASALHCGACGGHAGDVNARLLASLLNEPEVRRAVRERGIDIPDDTLFVGALHDTTQDRITLFTKDADTSAHRDDIATAEGWFGQAGALARAERIARLPNALADRDVFRRSRNWAEVRPEWALAGCHAFIAAPRAMTSGVDLGGRAFLHNYDPANDPDTSILELIMTAPVVVASWISLQYYGSAVAPEAFGGGNKVLHNVVGGVGVIEGAGGPLRAGLPWQSVHDGQRLVHEPVRLSVCIHAPIASMNAILEKHEGVRALFDNNWLHLFRLDETGRVASRYAGGLEWTDVAALEEVAPTAHAVS
jgi:uncharacterized protein YbcC (UPF0753/DUF2309 family)